MRFLQFAFFCEECRQSVGLASRNRTYRVRRSHYGYISEYLRAGTHPIPHSRARGQRCGGRFFSNANLAMEPCWSVALDAPHPRGCV